LREERRLRVPVNRVLRRIFEPKKDEVTGEWRKLHNEELNCVLLSKYYSGDQIGKNEVDRACSIYGGQTSSYRVLVWKPDRKGPLGRPRHRW
jgi:hypothetical protein